MKRVDIVPQYDQPIRRKFDVTALILPGSAVTNSIPDLFLVSAT